MEKRILKLMLVVLICWLVLIYLCASGIRYWGVPLFLFFSINFFIQELIIYLLLHKKIIDAQKKRISLTIILIIIDHIIMVFVSYLWFSRISFPLILLFLIMLTIILVSIKLFTLNNS